MKRYLTYILCAGVVVLLAAGCSTTKRLGDGEVLYTGVKKMNIEPSTDEKVPGAVESEVEDALSVKPNNPLYSPYVRTPFPVGLWVYNNMYTEKKKGLKSWIYRKLAKEPVLISNVQPDLRMDLVRNILDNHGYFGSTADFEILPKSNPKKARISYYVNIPQAWTYNTIAFPQDTCAVTGMINTLKDGSKLRVGERYDIDSLTDERVRITNIMRNRSYYYFRPDYLEYLADTTRQRLKVDLRMVMAQGIPSAALRQYKVGNVAVNLYSPDGGEPDSLYTDGIKVWYQGKLKFREKILKQSVKLVPGQPVTVDAVAETLNNMTKLGIFRYVNLDVTPLDSIKGRDSLDMTVTAALDTPLEAEFEADFSSKSNSFIGPGVIFGVKNKNMFYGGEIFAVRLNASYEWQTGNRSSASNATAVNSYELGVNTSLTFPRMLAPKFIPRSSRYSARTTFNLKGSLLNRPNFFTMLSANANVSYDFQSDGYSSHNLTIFKLTYNDMLRTTNAFDETMAANPAIALSFQDQFIPSASYTYTYDRKYGKSQQNRLIWQSTFTTAGNILAVAYDIFGYTDNKKLFGNKFSQFVKATTELKYYKQIGRFNTLATRLYVGAGHAYGNSEVLPYNEQFYIGGANSIRAFTIRSLGPGSYRADENDQYGYFDQTGDFKLEANVEFRFRILGGLNGAVFVDAGNIWLLKDDPERAEGKLRLNGLLDQIAVGTGAGLRYDLTFLVIRADMGIGIHTPYKNPEKSGYYNIPRFKDGLGFHLAIGYPF